MVMTINSDLDGASTLIKRSIQNLLIENKSKNESDREMRLDFYEGRGGKADYLEKYGFENRPVKIPTPFVNLTRRIIDKTSLVYKKPPGRRLLVGDKENEEFERLLNENKQLINGYKLAERYKNIMGNVLYRPMWYNGRWNAWIEHDFIPYFLDGDPLRPFAYSIPIKRDTTVTQTNKIENRTWYMYWSDQDYFWHDEMGNTKPDPSGLYDDMKNPFPRLPFVELRRDPAISEYWGDGPMDIVKANQAINITWCDLIYSQHNQAFNQVYVTGMTQEDIKEGKGGADKIWTVSDSESTIGVLDYNPKIEALLQSIKDQTEYICSNYNLNVKWSQDGNPASGFALVVANIDLMEAREDDVDRAVMQEDEIYDIIQMQTEYFDTGYKLPERKGDVSLSVNFQELNFPTSKEEDLRVWDWEVQNNAKTIIDYIMLDQNLSRDEAEERFEENKKANKQYSFRESILREELEKPETDTTE